MSKSNLSTSIAASKRIHLEQVVHRLGIADSGVGGKDMGHEMKSGWTGPSIIWIIKSPYRSFLS